MNSIWTKTVNMPKFPALDGDIKTDVLIIGGGMAGILCAHFLKKQGVDYVLAEGRTNCSGVTKNTTAKITSQHGLIYQKIAKQRGEEMAVRYLHANQAAVRAYGELAKTIECDFQRKTNYVYSLNDRKKLEKEMKVLEKLGFDGIFAEYTELPLRVEGSCGLSKSGAVSSVEIRSRTGKGAAHLRAKLREGIEASQGGDGKGRYYV